VNSSISMVLVESERNQLSIMNEQRGPSDFGLRSEDIQKHNPATKEGGGNR
jgi:hypothetical protein